MPTCTENQYNFTSNNSILGNCSLTNSQVYENEDKYKSYNWPVLFLFFIVVTAICGNILVCLAVKYEIKLRNTFNYFLVSLAISDMMCAIVVMPVSIIRTFLDDLEVPHLMCTVWYALDVLFTSSTIIHLTMISVDRYMALKNPLKHGAMKRTRHTIMKIGLVWILAFCAAGPLFIFSMFDKKKHVNYKGCGPEGPLFVITATVITFYLPLLIMTIMYILTVLALHKQSELQKKLQKVHTKPVEDNTQQKLYPNLQSADTMSPNAYHFQHSKKTQLTVPDTNNQNRISEANCTPLLDGKILENTQDEVFRDDGTELKEMVTLSTSQQFCGSNCSLYANNNCHSRLGSSTNVSEFEQSLSNSSELSPEDRLTSTTDNVPSGNKTSIVNKIKASVSHRKRHKKRYHSSVEKSRKAVQVLGVLFAVFVICYLPFFLAYVIKGTCLSECLFHIPDNVLSALEWLAYSGSMFNPIIYHIFNPKFRKTFYQLIKCEKCKRENT